MHPWVGIWLTSFKVIGILDYTGKNSDEVDI